MTNVTICKNCQQKFEGKYCNHCGQAAKTERLDFHFLIHEFEHGVFHFDHGILFTLKKLFTSPGESIRNYLKGKRANLTSPFTTVVLVATAYTLFSHLINHREIGHTTRGNELATFLSDWINHHYVGFTILTIPLYSLGTFVAFRKYGYNFVEYMALNSYKASQRLFTHLFTLPIIVYFNTSHYLNILYVFLYACDIALIYWTNILFFNRLNKLRVLLLTIISHLIFIALLTLIMGLLNAII